LFYTGLEKGNNRVYGGSYRWHESALGAVLLFWCSFLHQKVCVHKNARGALYAVNDFQGAIIA